jgi:predicted 2-oxoglutarate/Fe(II)-dependent dioxygenase YbiX
LSKNIKDYIKIYQSLDNTFCKKIKKELDSVVWEQHKFYNVANNNKITRSGNNELDISNEFIPSQTELMQKVWEAIHQYILIDCKNSYYQSWQGFTPIRFNRYKINRVMAMHCDHIHSIFDGTKKGIPTLTVIGALNDNYEGGEFLMFEEEEEYKLKPGEIIIFPSLFLYPHKVAPVTKGVRDTFVSWVF